MLVTVAERERMCACHAKLLRLDCITELSIEDLVICVIVDSSNDCRYLVFTWEVTSSLEKCPNVPLVNLAFVQLIYSSEAGIGREVMSPHKIHSSLFTFPKSIDLSFMQERYKLALNQLG